jgi:hypothetical protein
MGRHVGRGGRVARGTGGGAGRGIAGSPGGRMGREGCGACLGGPDPAPCPGPGRFDRLPGPVVMGAEGVEMAERAFRAVRGPERQRSPVGPAGPELFFLVFHHVRRAFDRPGGWPTTAG